MQIFQPPVNFCSDKNIQTIFGTKLEDFLNYRIDYNLISQTVEKVVKKIFFHCTLYAVIYYIYKLFISTCCCVYALYFSFLLLNFFSSAVFTYTYLCTLFTVATES
jgi:hypothetical protein